MIIYLIGCIFSLISILLLYYLCHLEKYIYEVIVSVFTVFVIAISWIGLFASIITGVILYYNGLIDVDRFNKPCKHVKKIFKR